MREPPTFPALSGSRIATEFKDGQIEHVLNDKPGTAMASFKQLSDVAIAAVITYECNSWNNKTGDMVSPAEVKQLRK